jgi:hypothetical protein
MTAVTVALHELRLRSRDRAHRLDVRLRVDALISAKHEVESRAALHE